MTEQPATPVVYEEWIAHPDKRAFILVAEHSKYANNPGWWTSGWQGDEVQVGHRIAARQSAVAGHDGAA